MDKDTTLSVAIGAVIGEGVGLWKIFEQIDFMHHLEAIMLAVETAGAGALTGLLVRWAWMKIVKK